jgi:hypothetical protein
MADHSTAAILATLCVIDQKRERLLLWERGIEIARECLAGDPGRPVPELDVETCNLFEAWDGGNPQTEAQAMALRTKKRLAFAVAARALQIADSAAGG